MSEPKTSDARAYLFVGGPRDGTWRTVEGEKETILFHEAIPPLVLEQVSDALANHAVQIKPHLYHRMQLRGNSRSFWIYAYHGITADEVFAKLLEGYRPK